LVRIAISLQCFQATANGNVLNKINHGFEIELTFTFPCKAFVCEFLKKRKKILKHFVDLFLFTEEKLGTAEPLNDIRLYVLLAK
jgi:hypothetical protein